MAAVPPEQFQFAGPTYLAASPVLDCQRSINLYPDPGIASSKSLMGLVGRPGLAAFSTPGTGAGHSLWAGEGRLFAAQGGHVYEIDDFGGVITDYGNALNIATPTPAPFASNNQQLLICDPLLHKLLYINPVGPSLDLVLNANALEYCDGFHFALAQGASLAGTNPNQINASNFLDAGTAGSWNALNYVLRTGTSDQVVQLASLNNLLWIFGRRNTEAWYNAGNQGFPFARVSGSTVNVGCLAPWSVAKFLNTALWLGCDDSGYGQVYRLNGTNPQRVSNAAIESMIAAYVTQNGLPYARGIAYQEAGHAFYCLCLCNSSYQCSQMLVYDLTTGLWHERSYGAAFSVNYPAGFASVPNFGAPLPNFIINQAGAIQNQSITYASDAGTAITYTRTSPHVSRDNKLHSYNRFELDCDIGTAAPTLDYSNDGGRNFRGRSIALAQASDAIAPGSFKRFYAQQLGSSRDRAFKVTITDSANLIRIANALLDVG